jgi:biotin synthase
MNTSTAPQTLDAILEIFARPFNDLIFEAQRVHRLHFDPNAIQCSTLLSIKTGDCPEDCGYCSQSIHHQTALKAETLMDLEQVRAAAQEAKANGAQRLYMGAAWRSPHDKDIEKVAAMISVVKEYGLESCVTLGMLKPGQAERLQHAGLDYYNHNIDTSPEFYGEVIHTRSYQDRLDTLEAVRDAGIRICSGGILGMGESRRDRARMLQVLAQLPQAPERASLSTPWSLSLAPRWRLRSPLTGSNSCAPLRPPESSFPRPMCGCRQGARP